MTGWGTAVLASLMLWVSTWTWFNSKHPKDHGANLIASVMIALVPAAIDIVGTVFYKAVVIAVNLI